MIEDKDREWKFSLDLPDFEAIFVLTAVCILSGIFVAVSLVIAFTLSTSYFDGLSMVSFESADSFFKTIGDTLLYLGGMVFALSSILFLRAFLKSLVTLYDFSIKGDKESPLKIPDTVKSLYQSVLVGGGAAILIFIGIILTQLYDIISDSLILGGW